MSFTTHNTSLFFSATLRLVPETLALKHCRIEGVVLNSLTLKIMPVFWHTNPPEIRASACFGSSLLILINGKFLPVL